MDKKRITLYIILLLVVGSIYYLEQSKVSPSEITSAPSNQAPLKDGQFPLAPELAGISGYFNTIDGLKLEDLRGKVVLIDFWTYTCINCIRTLPHLVAWDEKYRDDGLVIIGVHTPEFEFEKKQENVQMALEKYGIEYPVVQDNSYATWNNFQNRYWPHKYLIDSEGYIRYHHIGEGAYAETEENIQQLLMEINGLEDTSFTNVEDTTPSKQLTPELYAGYDFALPRGQDIGNPGGLRVGEINNYNLNLEISHNLIYLQGLWKSNEDNLEAKGDSSIFLGFTAQSVNIVADNFEDPVKIEIRLNGKYITKEQAGNDVKFLGEQSFIKVNEPRLYNVVNGEYGTFLLDLSVTEGFSFNAFTFG